MDENHNKPQPPTIIIRLTNAKLFEVQIDIGNESLQMVRAMLNETIKTIDQMILDTHEAQKARAFQAAAAMTNQRGGITQ